MQQSQTDIFEKASPYLMGLAYRLLGTVAEAEDAVQDTYLKWQTVNPLDIRNAEAWLTTCCTNICLDVLKSARKSRTDYVGPWLPEPLHTRTEDTPEEHLMLTSSLTTAFLLLLERLTPKERAAYLLHEIFDYSYADIAGTLAMQEAGCRKLVSRAKQYVGQEKSRSAPSNAQQMALLSAFQEALKTGRAGKLESLLSQSIELRADSGGKVIAVREVLSGPSEIISFITDVLAVAWQDLQIRISEINGSPGMTVIHEDEVIASLSFGYSEEGKAQDIFIMRNPDKLKHILTPIQHDGHNGALTQH